MSQFDLLWSEPAARHGSADADQRNEPEFDVVPIGRAIEIQVFDRDGERTL
jgi:hypothetical protein